MKQIAQLIRYSQRLLAAGSLLLAPLLLPAQQADTLAGYRKFIAVCNSYKTLPLQVDLEVRSCTFMPGINSDTVTQEAAFYLDASGSYIRYGEVEQLVNDSLMLLVSNQAQKMILYSGKQNITAQLQKMSGFLMADSSIQKLALAFTVQTEQPAGDTIAGLLLQSRARLQFHTLPRQEICIQYRPQTGHPAQVIQTARELVPLEAAQYQLLLQQAGNEKKLVVANGQYYLIKEQTNIFRYQSVNHRNNQPLPVLPGDRIARDASGELHPVSAFKDYSLTLF